METNKPQEGDPIYSIGLLAIQDWSSDRPMVRGGMLGSVPGSGGL